jgi:hypothetical protein
MDEDRSIPCRDRRRRLPLLPRALDRVPGHLRIGGRDSLEVRKEVDGERPEVAAETCPEPAVCERERSADEQLLVSRDR